MLSLFTNNYKIALSGAATSSSFAEPNPIHEFVASREDASNIWLTARIGRRPPAARRALAARRPLSGSGFERQRNYEPASHQDNSGRWVMGN